MNHFFVKPEAVHEDRILIEGLDVRHIRQVLRMKTGEPLLLSDGEGQDYLCEIAEMKENGIICRILSRESSGTEPSVRFHLFQGLPKADKLEHIIQKSVELGVYRVVPVETARSIVHYDAKKQKSKQERWQKIAESAAKQSRRGIIPEVSEILSFKQAVKAAAGMDLVLLPYENFKDIKKTREILAEIRPGMQVAIFIGPEGGFEQGEVELACKDVGARTISLGSRILRTETAPLMLLSVLMFAQET